MPEHTAARFVQNKVAQGLIPRDEASLIPESVDRRWGDTSDDDISNLTFGMAEITCMVLLLRMFTSAVLRDRSTQRIEDRCHAQTGRSAAVIRPLTRFGAPSAMSTVPSL